MDQIRAHTNRTTNEDCSDELIFARFFPRIAQKMSLRICGQAAMKKMAQKKRFSCDYAQMVIRNTKRHWRCF